MERFDGTIAVITGAGAGMGRDLAMKLAEQGAHLALCDLHADQVDETAELCRERNPGVNVFADRCDVTDEEQLMAFRKSVESAHDTDSVNLLFNNAGIGTAESFLEGDRQRWERTFDVCWNGVYLTSRVFLPLVVASSQGHVINTSSINGFWASLGPSRTHTAYAAAKFAVKGFTEALITELRLNAPHVGVSLVMPGHIGTEIVANSHAITLGEVSSEASENNAAFRNSAPTSSAEAAEVILDGVRQGRWRILVGTDAHILDDMVRAEPERAYEPSFVEDLQEAGILQGLVS